MNPVKKVPLPLSGVMLGTLALGNLLQMPLTAGLQPAGNTIRFICGLLAAVMLVLLLLKLIMYPKMFAEDMKNPIMAGVAATFPMALMLFSVYWKPVIKGASKVIWWIAIILQIVLIIYFTAKFIVKLDLKKVFAAYFIIYAGGTVSALTGPAYENLKVGTVFFWFGLITTAILLVIVTARYIKLPDVPDPAKPIFCIYAAPVALLTAGYVDAVMPKNLAFLKVLYIISLVLYVIALIKALGCLKLPFFPSYAAFTFPFVISAIAAKKTMACSMNLGAPWPWLKPVVIIETVIAVIFVVYAIIRFAMHIFGPAKKEA